MANFVEAIDFPNPFSENERMNAIRNWLFLLLVCLTFVPGAIAQPELPTGQEARSLAFSPDGKLLALAVGSPGELGLTVHRMEIWEVEAGKRRHAIVCEPQAFTAFVFSPDGTKLLSSGVRPWQVEKSVTSLIMWDTQTGEQVAALEVGAREIVLMPVFSPDGGLVAASAVEGSNETRTSRLKVWDAKTGRLKHEVGELGGQPSQVLFTPDGKQLLVAVADRLSGENTNSKLLFLERDSFRPTRTLPVKITQPAWFLSAPDSQSLAHYYATQNEEQAAESHLTIMALQGHHAPLPLQMETNRISLSAFTFTPAGDRFSAVVFFLGGKRPVEFWQWNTQTGQRLSAVPLGDYSMIQAMFAAISPDAQTVAFAKGTTVEVRRTSDGQVWRRFDVL